MFSSLRPGLSVIPTLTGSQDSEPRSKLFIIRPRTTSHGTLVQVRQKFHSSLLRLSKIGNIYIYTHMEINSASGRNKKLHLLLGYLYFYCKGSLGMPGWLSSLCLPLAQGMVPESWDWIPYQASWLEPAPPSACVSTSHSPLSLSLCSSWINK